MLSLKLWQLKAKYEMSHKLNMQQHTERLVFVKSSFKHVLKLGSELDWNNKRYDVVNAVYSADSVYIDAIDDKREQGILHYIGKFIHKQNKEGDESLKVSSLSLLIFQVPLPKTLAFVMPISDINCMYFFSESKINKILYPVKSPPPRW